MLIEWNLKSDPTENDAFLYTDLPYAERMAVIANLVRHYVMKS